MMLHDGTEHPKNLLKRMVAPMPLEVDDGAKNALVDLGQVQVFCFSCLGMIDGLMGHPKLDG